MVTALTTRVKRVLDKHASLNSVPKYSALRYVAIGVCVCVCVCVNDDLPRLTEMSTK